MAINLMGFVSGFAKGATQRITEEREKEETALSNRFKLAAVNKMTREKEANELKGLYAERIKNFNAAYPEAAEEEVLAAISTETSYNTLMDAYNKGRPLNLKEHLILNKDSIPEGFTTARSYLDEVIKPQVTMGGTSAQTRSVFGADVSPSEKARARAASQYGASADELESYAQSSGAVPDLPVFGSVIMKKDLTSKERLEEANAAATQAAIEFGEGTPQAEAAMDYYNKIKTLDEALNPTEAKWATYVSGLKLAMATGTPEQKAAAEAEFKREVVRIEAMSAKEKAETLPAMSTFGRVIAETKLAAMREKYGNKLDKNLRVIYATDGSASFQYIGTDLAMQEEIRQHGLDAAASIAELYLDADGRPLSRDMKAVLISQGYKFDSEGRMIKRAAPAPAAPAPAPAAPAPAAASSASSSQHQQHQQRQHQQRQHQQRQQRQQHQRQQHQRQRLQNRQSQ
jgi:hypothetical protein